MLKWATGFMVVVLLAACGVLGYTWWSTRADADAGPLPTVTIPAQIAPIPLGHALTVPSDAPNCPGFTVNVPAPPSGQLSEPENDIVQLGTTSLGPGTAMLFVCYGRTSDVGTAAEFTAEEVDVLDGVMVSKNESVEVRANIGEMVRRGYLMGEKGMRLTDWFFDHDGWLYGVGYVRAAADDTTFDSTVESVLQSWAWS